MKSGLALLKINTWLFSAIWTRKPVFIYSKDPGALNEYYKDLIGFIPKYRQAILVGDFPKKVQFGFNKPKLIHNDALPDVQDMLLNVFEEEKSLESRSLQLLVWEPSPDFVRQVLTRLERGWIATTSILPETLKTWFPEAVFEGFPLSKNMEVIFVSGHPGRVSIELEIMKTYFSRSPISAAFLIQKKLHEIKFIADAIMSEIGHGKKFHQVELQELFELDYQNFEKCLQIIEAEFHLDINRYIQRTSNQIKKILRQLLEIEGVIYACALRNGKLAGILKVQQNTPFPLSFFKKLIRANHPQYHNSLPGALDYIVFELNRKTKIILLPKLIPNSRSQTWFGFFISPKILVVPFIREVSKIIETIGQPPSGKAI
jgi:hypothetical protein